MNTLYRAAPRIVSTAASTRSPRRCSTRLNASTPIRLGRAGLMSAFFTIIWTANIRRRSDRRSAFLSIHPGNKNAPYAYYLIALSYYEQISDVTRDQKITQQARRPRWARLLRRYPDSRYAADARLKLDLVRDHLAGKEMEIGLYTSGARTGSRPRSFRRSRRQISDDQPRAQALFRLTECYLALGVPEEAKSAAVLGANYPGSKWYRRAYKLMEKHAPSA